MVEEQIYQLNEGFDSKMEEVNQSILQGQKNMEKAALNLELKMEAKIIDKCSSLDAVTTNVRL